jgi:hypothetical protein
MPSTYEDIGQNAWKTRESSNFGTRKLAFYTLLCDTAAGLGNNWQDSNSLYFKIVQRLQEGGVELYWLGEPQVLESPFNGSDAFTFAIADDADTPQKYLEDTSTYTVLGANLDGYDNYIKLDTTNTVNRGQPVVFGMTDDGVIAGKTFYVHSLENNNDYTYIHPWPVAYFPPESSVLELAAYPRVPATFQETYHMLSWSEYDLMEILPLNTG